MTKYFYEKMQILFILHHFYQILVYFSIISHFLSLHIRNFSIGSSLRSGTHFKIFLPPFVVGSSLLRLQNTFCQGSRTSSSPHTKQQGLVSMGTPLFHYLCGPPMMAKKSKAASEFWVIGNIILRKRARVHTYARSLIFSFLTVSQTKSE